MRQSEVRNRRFSVIGGARSGVAVAKLLRLHGAHVFLSDSAPAEKMRHVIVELEQAEIAFEFSANSRRVLDTDALVVSPGVPSDAPVVKEALARGLTVVSELEAASWFCRAPIIAITGTNGKTTTTTLTGRIFGDAKRDSVVAGNIGVAFSQVVDQLTEESLAIVEVSSFQLDHIESFRPNVAILLNITPDHLDRYNHSFEEYVAAKCRVFQNQRAGDTLIYNYDDEVVRTAVHQRSHPSVKKLPFSQKTVLPEGAFLDRERVTINIHGVSSAIVDARQISIQGPHNLANAMAASLAATSFGIPTASLRATLKNFKGVEHRLEFVRELNGITYVNDSKATNVDSVWFALQSFEKPIVVLLGGRDKGNDYSPLVGLVKKHVKAVVAIGESAGKVVQTFTPLTEVVEEKSMEAAVGAATRLASAGDVVLLSPACASFDWFENYEHRGRVFKDAVLKLQGTE